MLQEKIHTSDYILYQLDIRISKDINNSVNKILGIESNVAVQPGWTYEFRSDEKGKEHIDFVDYFLSMLEGKYDELNQIGIKRSNIYVWYICYSDSKYDMKFTPEQMYKLGKEGISLLISCYNADNEIY
jgi:hypothetical protein